MNHTLRSCRRLATALAVTAIATAASIACAQGASSVGVTKKMVKPAPAASAPSITKPSGLVYQSIQEGKGTSPTASDTVKVHYRGTFLDGREFDSSYARNEPATFPLGRVIKCWTEGVQLMKPGGKARLTCPPQIAYGERGAGATIPANATLYFDIELIEVNPR